MTMKNIFKYGVLLVAMALSGCSKDNDYYDDPPAFTPVVMDTNMTIAEFKAMYADKDKGDNKPYTIPDDIVIGGKVVSSDESGNIFKSLYIADETGGLEIRIGLNSLFLTYRLGQTVYVKAQWLTLGAYGGTPNLGMYSSNEKYETAYIQPRVQVERQVFRGVYGDPVEPVVVNSISELQSNPQLIGKPVTFKNLTYKVGSSYPEGVSTWGQAQNLDEEVEAKSVNQTFIPATGGEVTIRTSGYARYANQQIPTYPIDVTGLYTTYNGKPQILMMGLDGVKKVSE